MGNITAGHFIAGTLGAALLRNWYRDADINQIRLDELIAALEARDEFPMTMLLDPEHRDLQTGYAEWAPSYDGENPLITAEQPIVHAILAEHAGPGVAALDMGCGTGRHAEYLAAIGCDVVGVDASDAMLDVAREKIPSARFELGEHESLPLDDASIDLAVASLTLCHLPDPTAAMVELARVLRPGGTVVISDPHPSAVMIGGQAFYGGISPDRPMTWVENHYHGAATWFDAFRTAGLDVIDCQEPPINDEQIATSPLAPFYPDAVHQLLDGLPAFWLWVVRQPE